MLAPNLFIFTWPKVYYDVFRVHVTQWLICQTDKINTIFQVLCICEHRWFLVLQLTSVDQYKHPNSSVSGSKCISNQLICMFCGPKSIFDKKIITMNDRLRNKFETFIFHDVISFVFGIFRIFIMPNSKCIHVVLTILSPFQHCLFLVIQPSEVLLNLFDECSYYVSPVWVNNYVHVTVGWHYSSIL